MTHLISLMKMRVACDIVVLLSSFLCAIGETYIALKNGLLLEDETKIPNTMNGVNEDFWVGPALLDPDFRRALRFLYVFAILRLDWISPLVFGCHHHKFFKIYFFFS